MSKAPPKKPENKGSPAWVMTFADLMSLLMCFFVLLLSFSELDLQKYKQVAGSMKFAFGVQREVKTIEMPKGTSVIAREFSPGKPTPTIMKVIHQNTIDETKQTLEFTDAVTRREENEERVDAEVGKVEENTPMQARNINKIADVTIQKDETNKETLMDAEKLLALLEEEITNGVVEIETEGKKILVRIREKGSFPSGSATMKGDFLPVIAKLREALKHIKGRVLIAGHTDNVPIKNQRFRSNWELSASRAVTVVHELLLDNDLDQKRFLVEGHGEAHPLVPNDSRENRALNRRVELTIVQGEGVDEHKELNSEEAIGQVTEEQEIAGEPPEVVTEDPFNSSGDLQGGKTAVIPDETITMPDLPQESPAEGTEVATNQADAQEDETVSEISTATGDNNAPDSKPQTEDQPRENPDVNLDAIRERIEKFSKKMEKLKK